ncbi:MAG: serine/threonine protein kinase [bacterium]|nr:serine/threonine protein kinase [bacterium]
MDTGRWQQIDRIFTEALKLPDTDRPAFLGAACGADQEIRDHLEQLLAVDGELADFLEKPLAANVAELVGGGSEPEAGTCCGPYKLLRTLGRGGSGTVYLVEDDGPFALKLCRSSLEASALRRRFRQEHQILTRLDHPHVTRLHDAGVTAAGYPYLVMEFVDGTTIDEHCDERRLMIDERLVLFRQLCSAVAYAHDQGLVHRDLKPANVLVTKDGRVKLLDFGIAKLLISAPDQRLDSTNVGMRLMTLSYASPEQVRGRRVTSASDVYALGVLLFELLAGASPYRLKGPLALAFERAVCLKKPRRMSDTLLHLMDAGGTSQWDDVDVDAVSRHRRYADPRDLVRRLRGDLDAIVARAVEKRPEKRYGSVRELAEDVRRHQ